MSEKVHCAIKAHDLDALARQLAAGDDPNERPGNWSPLHNAVGEIEDGGDIEAVALLLRHGADPNIWTTDHDATPLLTAFFYKQYDAALLLLAAGADYPDAPADDRGCTECACGVPMGSGCIGVLRLYEDAACSREIVNPPLGSMGEACVNMIPQGRAIGAKRVTDLAYLSGTCGVSGGESIGNAIADAQRAVTFCCGKPEGQIE